MNNNFYTLLERILKRYGTAVLDDRARLKSILDDYAEGEFTPEIRLFLQAIEEGCHTKIVQANDLPFTANYCSRHLQDNYFLAADAADGIIALLCKLLRGYDPPEKTPAPVKVEAGVTAAPGAGRGIPPCGGQAPAGAVGGRYAPLYDYLRAQQNDTVVLSFPEIERILNAQLPPSAYNHRPWWANGGHTQANAWMAAGFLVHAVALGRSVSFHRR
jgi:hypothetical protein